MGILSDPVEGSLICQMQKDGSYFGGDYDGRLGRITNWIHRHKVFFENQVILDLGSNAGHFPVEYIRCGAKKVIAVEGREIFEKQWHGIKDEIFSLNADRIEWVSADVREVIIPQDYTMISCLGLAYHVPNIWGILRRVFFNKPVKTVLLETQLYRENFVGLEGGPRERDSTEGLEDAWIECENPASIRVKVNHFFPGNIWKVWETALYGYGNIDLNTENATPKVEIGWLMRGMWIATKSDRLKEFFPKNAMEIDPGPLSSISRVVQVGVSDVLGKATL